MRHTPERLLHLLALGDKDAARALLRDALRRGDGGLREAALRVLAPGLSADAQRCEGDLTLCDDDAGAFAALALVTGALTLRLTSAEAVGALGSLQVVVGTLRLEGCAALEALSLPRLESVGALVVEGNPALALVSLPRLRAVQGDVSVQENPALHTFVASAALTVGGQFTVTGPALLRVTRPLVVAPAAPAEGAVPAESAPSNMALDMNLALSMQALTREAASLRALSWEAAPAPRRRSGLVRWALSAALSVALGVVIAHLSPPRPAWDREVPLIVIHPPALPPLTLPPLPPALLEPLQIEPLHIAPNAPSPPRPPQALKPKHLLTLARRLCDIPSGLSSLRAALRLRPQAGTPHRDPAPPPRPP